MSSETTITSISSLILNLKKILNNIGNEYLSNLLNNLLLEEQKIKELTFSEKELFHLVTLNLENIDAETLEFKLKKQYEQICLEKNKLDSNDFSILKDLLCKICNILDVSEKILEEKPITNFSKKEAFSIFCFIGKIKYNYNIKQLGEFAKLSPRQIDRNISFVENLNPKFPTEQKTIEKLNKVKEILNPKITQQ